MMRYLKTTPLNKRQKGNNIFLVVLFFVLLILTFFIDPRDVSVLVCKFKGTTGYGCPTCGLSRSFYAFANLDIIKALNYHLLGPVIYISVVILSLKSATEIILDKKIALTIYPAIAKVILMVLLLTWFLLWINNFY